MTNPNQQQTRTFTNLDPSFFSNIEQSSSTKDSKLPTTNKTSNATINNGFKQKTIKINNIIGTRFRSKTGCLNCRKRKKKCDETSPICLACQSRNQECIWPDLTKNSKVKKQSTTTSLSSSLPTPAQSPSLSDIDQKRLNESILQRHNNTSSTNNKLKKIKNPNLDSLVREFASEKEEAMDDIGHLNMNVISCHK